MANRNFVPGMESISKFFTAWMDFLAATIAVTTELVITSLLRQFFELNCPLDA